MSAGRVPHLYVHLPFCASRCGYCDFVTLVGRLGEHARYVDAVLAELELERGRLADEVETVFLGGGTPTFTEPAELRRLLDELPAAEEVTVEANPETVTLELAALLGTRVSRGLAWRTELERLLTCSTAALGLRCRSAFYHHRDAKFDNINLISSGIPGQGAPDLGGIRRSSPRPEPVCYELEAGARFTHAHGGAARQAESMEDISSSSSTRSPKPATAGTRPPTLSERRARHNLVYWLGRLSRLRGIGAIGGLRWRGLCGATSRRWQAGKPPRGVEPLAASTKTQERLMLGLRLDDPLPFAQIEAASIRRLVRLEGLGLVERQGDGLLLTRRGRLLGGGVTVKLLAEIPANNYN
jgi:oxygen-independent coproporphyrinogen-3 oxidase